MCQVQNVYFLSDYNCNLLGNHNYIWCVPLILFTMYCGICILNLVWTKFNSKWQLTGFNRFSQLYQSFHMANHSKLESQIMKAFFLWSLRSPTEHKRSILKGQIQAAGSSVSAYSSPRLLSPSPSPASSLGHSR